MFFAQKLRQVLASRKFFVFIVVLLVAQALWLVFSFSYAMLWDEYYHFGIIQFYAHHLSPFISHQPHSADIYGEIIRYPAWLYHWLMSFPYRLIAVFTSDRMTQVIILRLINVALFAGGLVAYRAAMLRVTKSKALVHFVLLLLVLFPLSSLLAAQINYDNLQFLLTGMVFYWTLRFVQAEKFASHWLLLALGVGLLACVVKYTFLPLFAVQVIFLAYWIVRRYGRRALGPAAKSFLNLSRTGRLGLVVLMLLGLGLFAERYGINIVEYGAVDPACHKVLNVQRCLSYSPYARNYGYDHTPNPPDMMGPVVFTGDTWLPSLYEQYFSTGTRLSYAHYTVKAPLPIPFYTMAAAGVVAGIGLLLAGWRLLKRPEIQLLVLSMLALGAALWVTNYGGYSHHGHPVAIQGRYLLPMVPFGLLIGGLAVARVLTSRRIKAAMASIAILGLLAGGGLITHLVRSEPSWYWHNHTVISVNNNAGQALDFLELGT